MTTMTIDGLRGFIEAALDERIADGQGETTITYEGAGHTLIATRSHLAYLPPATLEDVKRALDALDDRDFRRDQRQHAKQREAAQIAALAEAEPPLPNPVTEAVERAERQIAHGKTLEGKLDRVADLLEAQQAKR